MPKICLEKITELSNASNFLQDCFIDFKFCTEHNNKHVLLRLQFQNDVMSVESFWVIALAFGKRCYIVAILCIEDLLYVALVMSMYYVNVIGSNGP